MSAAPEMCGADGGQGLGAGHRCTCVGLKDHAPYYGKGHGCVCGALWDDPTIKPEPVPEPMSSELNTIVYAATSWLHELESEIIPGADPGERPGYQASALELRMALKKIGADV